MTTPFVPQFQQQQIPIAGRGAVVTVQDPLQEASRLLALILERRGREKRARTERKGVRAAEVQERTDVRQEQLEQRQAGALLDLAKGTPVSGPELTAAFTLKFGRAPEDKEIIGGPTADFRRRIAVGMLTELEDPELSRRLSETAAVLAVSPRGILTTSEGARAAAEATKTRDVFTRSNIEAAERLLEALPEEDQLKARMFLVTQLVPGQIDLMELDVQLRSKIIGSGLDVINDPNNELALLIKKGTDLDVGDIVGASALGISQLMSVVFDRSTTPDDFEVTRNNVIQELSVRYSISPALMRKAFDLKDAGVPRAEVPARFRPAFDALDAGASAAMQSALGDAFKNSPEFLLVRNMIELGRQVNPTSRTFAELASSYTRLMKFALLQQSPNFGSLEQDLRSDDLQTSENAARELQERIDELDIAIPSFSHAIRIPVFKEGGTRVTGGKPLSEIRGDIDQVIAELERLGLDLDEPVPEGNIP